jgi:hypothetical protein
MGLAIVHATRLWFITWKPRSWIQVEKFHFLWYNAVLYVKSYWRFRITCRLYLQGIGMNRAGGKQNSCFALTRLIFSTLNIVATFFSETSADFRRITKHHTPEDRTLHNHRCVNLKSLFPRYFVWYLLWIIFGNDYIKSKPDTGGN